MLDDVRHQDHVPRLFGSCEFFGRDAGQAGRPIRRNDARIYIDAGRLQACGSHGAQKAPVTATDFEHARAARVRRFDHEAHHLARFAVGFSALCQQGLQEPDHGNSAEVAAASAIAVARDVRAERTAYRATLLPFKLFSRMRR